MTENTNHQIEILTPTQDEPASCLLSTRYSAEQRKIKPPAVQNHNKEKERKGANCWRSTHVTLNWLEQLKKWRWPFYKQVRANVT